MQQPGVAYSPGAFMIKHSLILKLVKFNRSFCRSNKCNRSATSWIICGPSTIILPHMQPTCHYKSCKYEWQPNMARLLSHILLRVSQFKILRNLAQKKQDMEVWDVYCGLWCLLENILRRSLFCLSGKKSWLRVDDSSALHVDTIIPQITKSWRSSIS